MFMRYMIILLLFAFTIEGAIIRNGYEYHEDSKVWFKLHNEKTRWHEARKICDSEGALLASPMDQSFKLAIEEIVRTTTTVSNTLTPVFVGVHATISAAVWHSVEGTPLSTLAAHVNAINLTGSQRQCSVYAAGVLSSANCSDQYPFICYKRESHARILTACKTTDTGYEYNQTTGSCYKFHTSPLTWTKAYEKCYSENAHLVIINSQTEATLVHDIFKRNRNSTSTDYLSVGVIDWEKNQNWYTIHGEKLQDSGYIGWATNEPNGAYYCGFLSLTSGLMLNLGCDTSARAFLCEKDRDILNATL